METVDLLQATLDSIGESDNEIGGFFQTKLLAQTTPSTQAPDTFLWDSGGLIYSIREPTEFAVGDWIRLEEDGRAFQITDISFNVSQWEITVDLLGATPAETEAISLTGTPNWVTGPERVLLDETEVAIDIWVWADSDKQWFKIIDLDVGVVLIENPNGFTFPTGMLASSRSINPVTSKVTTSILVETTLNWPASGKIAIDGILYTYGSKTLDPPSFDELTYIDGGETVVGLRQTHNARAVVTDLTKERNAAEQTRQAMLSDYADGDDLNAIGRNYGVLRYPFLESDDIFRAVVQALAYNPRGTVFGMELALDALVGAGNYELYEDLINYPNTVFIRLLGDAATTDEFVGKAFLTGKSIIDPTTTTSVDLPDNVVSQGTVHSVRLATEDHLSDFRNQKPSADTREEIESVIDSIWTYGGPSEATNVTLIAGEGVVVDHQAAQVSRYEHTPRILSTSYVAINSVMQVESGTTLHATFTQQWCVLIQDNGYMTGWGCYEDDATHYFLVLTSGTAATGATPIRLTKGVYYAVEIRKYGEDCVELWVDGVMVDRLLYSAFTTVLAARKIIFGINATGAPTTVSGRFRQLGFYVRTALDYWGLLDDAAQVAAANPARITASGTLFLSTDVGKRIDVTEGTTTNAQGGTNNGEFEVASFVDTANVEVQGPTNIDAITVQTVNPLRITVDDRQQQFEFPRDLGKEIVLSGSAQGNDGTYVIDKLLDPDTFVDLETWATPLVQKTNVCVIVEPAPGFEFVSETGFNWRMDPVFVTENPVSFYLSEAGSEAASTLTLRMPLPTADTYVEVSFSEVLSALVLLDFSVKNVQIQELPTPLWEYYPFYLSDPLGFVRAYLDDLTAAGVIPEYSLE